MSAITAIKQEMQQKEKKKNIGEKLPKSPLTTGNKKVIKITELQLKIVATLTPFSGNISALYSHTIGPKEREYPKQKQYIPIDINTISTIFSSFPEDSYD